MVGLEKHVWNDTSVFETLGSAWDALVAQSAFPSPFMTPAWHACWWRHFPEGELHVVAWFDEDTLVGLAPLYTAPTPEPHLQCCLRPVGGVEVADYLDILAPKGREEEVLRAFLEHLTGADVPAWEEVHLINLPEATPTHRLLPALAKEYGLWAWVDVEDVCPVIPLPDSFDAYLAMLNKKQRHEVRRKRRRLYEAAQKVVHHVIAENEDLDEWMSVFVSLHRRSDPRKAQFMTPRMEGFFRDVARLGRERGWLHLSFLEVDDRPVATLLCFDYGDRRMVYNSGFDPEVARPLAPGVNLVVMEIEDAIRRGLRLFDFLQGDEEYKFRLGAQPTYVYRVHIRREPPPVAEQVMPNHQRRGTKKA